MSKKKQYRTDGWDDSVYEDEYQLHRTKEEKMRNKRKERRIDHAIRTKNMQELLELEDDSNWE